MTRFLIIILSLVGGYVFAACSPTMTRTTPTNNFVIDLNSSIVIDKTTGLMWKRCLENYKGDDCSERIDSTMTGKRTFHTEENAEDLGALEYVKNLNNSSGFAGFSDWRVPNIKELRSIVEEACFNPAVNEEVFPSVPSNADVFSSTPHSYFASDDVWILIVTFANGTVERNSIHKYNYVRYLRLVRDAVEDE